MNEYVHIVSLLAPSPPDFGGAFDLYYKIPALAKAGKKIILHYFDYKENRGVYGLEPYCEEINVYNRSVFLKSLLTLQPHIVSSRVEPELIHRINRDDYPVILEGIHCTGIISSLRKRKIFIRVHNDEAEYYKSLYQSEQNIFKAAYFFYEAFLLSRYQKKLTDDAMYLFVSETDGDAFKEKYHHSNQIFLPCFLPWQNVGSLTGKGNYCLYHGNLTVSENNSAAIWLAEMIFSQISFPFIIAGKGANDLKTRLPQNDQLRLIDNPSDEELSGLITNAHIHVLPSFNTTGVKLKLLHALFEGRFVVTNDSGIEGSGIHAGIHLANDAESTIAIIKNLLLQEFAQENISERMAVTNIYNNDLNAQKITELL